MVLRVMGFVAFGLFLTVLGACGSGQNGQQDPGVHFVRADAEPGGDGTSWETAFQHPQEALGRARYGDQVWVAVGRYGPLAMDGLPVLVLEDGVRVLGGFAGSETVASLRAPGQHATVLDGEGVSYHVVVGAERAVLDGFIVTGGNAHGNVLEGRYGGTFTGGGMFNAGVSPEIRNCLFTGNAALTGGGALYNEDNAPLIQDCVFEYNQADFGGAIQNRNSAARIINSHFRNNASRLSGGGIASFDSEVVFINSVFSGNLSTYVGGAVLANSSDSRFTNCSFTGNRAQAGGGITMWKGSASVRNSILWKNAAEDGSEISVVEGVADVQFSIVKGGFTGNGNQDADPCFTADGRWGADGYWVEGVYQLAASSPAIDSGTDLQAPDFDLQYNARPQAMAHDLGAYERTY